MTLKQLEAFYWAATCRNFTVASQRVHLSVSSLSKRLVELEESLGVTLFDRSGRSAVLTTDGERLLPSARQVLHAATSLRQTAGREQGLHGKCRVGMGELSGLTWLPKLAKALATEHPALRFSVQVDVGASLRRAVGDGDLDVAVLAGASDSMELRSEWLLDVEFVWVAGQEITERLGSTFVRDLLVEVPLVCLPEGAGSTRLVQQWLSRAQAAEPRWLTCNSWSATVGLITGGVGFSYIPRSRAEALHACGRIALLSDETPLKPLSYFIAWRADDERALVNELRKIVKRVAEFQAPRAMG